MKIGRGYKWNYGAGVWTKKKITPDQSEMSLIKPRKKHTIKILEDIIRDFKKQIRD